MHVVIFFTCAFCDCVFSMCFFVLASPMQSVYVIFSCAFIAAGFIGKKNQLSVCVCVFFPKVEMSLHQLRLQLDGADIAVQERFETLCSLKRCSLLNDSFCDAIV